MEIPIKDRLGTIKEVLQWIKKYHELIVADGFSHLLVILHQDLHFAGAHSEQRDPFDQMLAKPVQAQKTSADVEELGVPFIAYSALFCNEACFQT